MNQGSKKKLVRCVGVLAWIGASACSAGSQDSGADDPNGREGSSAANSFSQVSGTIGGKPFVPKSGLLHVDGQGDFVDLLFSDTPDLCTDLANQIVHPGETLLQAYDLQLADASKKSYLLRPEYGELKVARVAATCESGAAVVADYHQDESHGVSYTITIDDPTVAPVTGEFHVAFQDGSNVDFAFSVPICGVNEAEHATCR